MAVVVVETTGSQGQKLFATETGQPLSPCCKEIMYAAYKKTYFKNLDYIYCSKCNQHIGGNGELLGIYRPK